MDIVLVSYLAGYFDGEGCISVLMQARELNPTLRIAIISADYPVVKLFGKSFGQIVYEIDNRSNGVRSTRHYRWAASSVRAVRVLEILLPSLIAKKEEAAIALSTDWGTRLNDRNKTYLIPERIKVRDDLKAMKEHRRTVRED